MILAQRQEFQYEDVEVGTEQDQHSCANTQPRRRLRWRPNAAALSLVCIAIVAICLGSIMQRTSIVTAGYRLQEAQSALSEVKEKNVRLNLTISSLKSLDRIESVARTELGMVSPEKVEFLVLNDPVETSRTTTTVAASKPGWSSRLLTALGDVMAILLPGDTAQAGMINR